MKLFITLQETMTTATDTIADVAITEKTMTIAQLLKDSGLSGQIIIYIILGLLSIGLFIYFERLSAINAASKIDKSFMNQIRDYIKSGKIDSAKILCAQSNTPAARLVEKGISRIGKPLDDINKAIENAGSLEIYNLEKNTSVLATIAGSAPMLGFLGTVVGMIIAFHNMATSGGQAEMGVLAGGIYTAMTTTVAGLVVGIVAYIAYNHLVVKTSKVIHLMEANAVEFLDLLNEPV
jgi:biopolymer transport protein ExbB